jgi:hypothetical protein
MLKFIEIDGKRQCGRTSCGFGGSRSRRSAGRGSQPCLSFAMIAAPLRNRPSVVVTRSLRYSKWIEHLRPLPRNAVPNSSLITMGLDF